jgi:hypothetical protein
MANSNDILRAYLLARLNGRHASPLNPPPLPPTRGGRNPANPAFPPL